MLVIMDTVASCFISGHMDPESSYGMQNNILLLNMLDLAIMKMTLTVTGRTVMLLAMYVVRVTVVDGIVISTEVSVSQVYVIDREFEFYEFFHF